MHESEKTPASRRSFVKVLAVGLAAAAAAVASGLRTPGTRSANGVPDGKKKRKVQYAMVIDVRRCIGCHACTVACKSEFDVPVGENRSWVEYTEKGVYPNVGRSFLPRLCNHCSEPPCVRVCPTNAT